MTPAATPRLARIVILGVTGDLARRYLIPAIASLDEAGRLPRDVDIVGVGRTAIDTAELRRRLAAAIPERGSNGGSIVERIRYVRATLDEPDDLRDVIRAHGPVVVYLALPPAAFEPAIRSIRDIGPPDGSRIVVEKPFGSDLVSARRLNALIHEAFPEDAVYRIDHFLHRQTVQNVLGLRFANRVFEPLWNREHLARIEIRWDETIGAEGRAGYYDRAGALRDMVQNHLLQLACLVGMEPPATLSARDLRDRKVEFLRAVRRLSPQDVAARTVRARYIAGRVGGRAVGAYVDEDGVDPARGTETFAEVTLAVDNWRWADVPFVLRTGKALERDRREIVLVYRDVPHLAFGPRFRPVQNRLRLEINPDRLALDVNVNGAGDPFELEDLEFHAALPAQELSPYSRLLLDVIEGDPVLSIRHDEAEEAWRIVDPIVAAWQADATPITEYRAGSDGPARSRMTGSGS